MTGVGKPSVDSPSGSQIARVCRVGSNQISVGRDPSSDYLATLFAQLIWLFLDKLGIDVSG